MTDPVDINALTKAGRSAMGFAICLMIVAVAELIIGAFMGNDTVRATGGHVAMISMFFAVLGSILMAFGERSRR